MSISKSFAQELGLINGEEDVLELNKKVEKDQLVEEITRHNELYRSGNPEITDFEYDNLIRKLVKLDPTNELLDSVEVEKFNKNKVKHEVPMLSIEKAFSVEELEKFFKRVDKIKKDVTYRVTPKLDGMAAKDSNGVLATRGDGKEGYDITDAFEKGLVYDMTGPYNNPVGEIVMSKSYFEENLTDYFEHPRNCVVGAIKCDTPNTIQKKSFEDGAIKFVTYDSLNGIHGTSNHILNNLDTIIDYLSKVDYPIDGFVIEVCKNFPEVIKELGSTSHHNKWQIAYKIQGEKKQTVVKSITWQTGRGGNITPVLELEPVYVSGAKISRVTAHNYGYLTKKKIGPGTVIEIIRSGEVIPKVVGVVSGETVVDYVKNCPVCGNETVLINDIINCPNFDCGAQITGRIQHFFKTFKIDGYGGKTIQTIIDNGVTKLEEILNLEEDDFIRMSFGERQAENLVSAVQYSFLEEYEDWKILASVSIPMLGRGDSKKLLKSFEIYCIFDLTKEDIVKIDGFGEKKAEAIVNGLKTNFNLIRFLMAVYPDFISSRKLEENKSDVLSGNFVFTGAMSKPREAMMKLCEDNGGTGQKSLTKKTDYLVTGEKVGKTKVDKAKKYGTTVITEEEFLKMLK